MGNCVDCWFLIQRWRSDGSTERFCSIDSRSVQGVVKCSGWEKREEPEGDGGLCKK